MFARVSQLGRHLSHSLPHYTHSAAAAAATSAMTSSTLQQKSMIHTAGCIIIGDEVLGGKTVDTNSAYMAKFCFSLGMSMKRVEVIADDEDEIIEATRRMSKNYDFVVTSGGIGPTHDDITYQSIAKAFGLELKLHEATVQKMRQLSRPHKSQPNFDWDSPSPALKAKMRMAELPWDSNKSEDEQVIFVKPELWVPISVVNDNIHILPGVPRLFEQLLTGLKPMLLPRLQDPDGKGTYRMLFSTPLAESSVAGYLTELAAKVEPKGVKVGSYPRWGKKKNVVTLVGTDREYMDTLEEEVAKGVEGKRVQVEGEDDTDAEEDIQKDKDA
jgi:molybdenum cofactor synthesis domain-containing protein